MKKFGSYLLFWKEYNDLIFVIHLVCILVFLWGFGATAFKCNNFVPDNVSYLLLIGAALIFTHLITLAICLSYFITCPIHSSGHWEFLETNSGELIELKGPVPFKGKRFSIMFPEANFEKMTKFFVYPWVLGKYKHSRVEIPVTLKFYMQDKTDVIELYHLLAKAQPELADSGFDLSKYIIDNFNQANVASLERIDEIVGVYSRSEISEPEFLDQVIELLVIPEWPFKGVKMTNLCLGSPIITSCKGKCENQ